MKDLDFDEIHKKVSDEVWRIALNKLNTYNLDMENREQTEPTLILQIQKDVCETIHNAIEVIVSAAVRASVLTLKMYHEKIREDQAS